MSQPKPDRDMDPDPTADPRWKDLYQIGGITSIALAFIVVFAIIGFFIWPYEPGLVPTADIFAALQNDRLGALMALDIVFIVGTLVSVLPVLALYVALRQVNESYALIALALGFMGIMALIPARPLAELVSLSNRYAAATTDAVRSQYLTAGEALLAFFSGTGWIINIVLVSVSSLISCLLMLRSNIFGKGTAYLGIVLNIMVLLFFLPVVGLFLLFLGTLGSVVFSILVGLGLLRLARHSVSAWPVET